MQLNWHIHFADFFHVVTCHKYEFNFCQQISYHENKELDPLMCQNVSVFKNLLY